VTLLGRGRATGGRFNEAFQCHFARILNAEQVGRATPLGEPCARCRARCRACQELGENMVHSIAIYAQLLLADLAESSPDRPPAS
jgi:hypothetical protein